MTSGTADGVGDVRGVLATGPMTVHQALLFRQLSERVIVLANGVRVLAAATPSAALAEPLQPDDRLPRERPAPCAAS